MYEFIYATSDAKELPIIHLTSTLYENHPEKECIEHFLNYYEQNSVEEIESDYMYMYELPYFFIESLVQSKIQQMTGPLVVPFIFYQWYKESGCDIPYNELDSDQMLFEEEEYHPIYDKYKRTEEVYLKEDLYSYVEVFDEIYPSQYEFSYQSQSILV